MIDRSIATLLLLLVGIVALPSLAALIQTALPALVMAIVVLGTLRLALRPPRSRRR